MCIEIYRFRESSVCLCLLEALHHFVPYFEVWYFSFVFLQAASESSCRFVFLFSDRSGVARGAGLGPRHHVVQEGRHLNNAMNVTVKANGLPSPPLLYQLSLSLSLYLFVSLSLPDLVSFSITYSLFVYLSFGLWFPYRRPIEKLVHYFLHT